MKNIVLVLALALAGCASSNTPTYTLPLPTQVTAPRPGELVLDADWTPPLQATALCGGSPFACVGPADAKWGLQQATDISKLTSVPGVLSFDSGQFSGFSLVSTQKLDRTNPMSLRATVQIDDIYCDSGVGYTGPVIYSGGVDDGDPTGRYRANYISCFAGDKKVRLWLYSPTYAGVIWDFDFRDGQQHELGLDWYPGDHVDYLLDGAVIFTEGKSFGKDPLDEPTSPSPALWFGSVKGKYFRFTAFN